jgi:hypothetical protein
MASSTTRTSTLERQDVASIVVPYLGVKSMLSFCSSSKPLNAVLAAEITRRKTVFASNKAQVKQLLSSDYPSRSQVLDARKLYSEARCLIDHELDLLDAIAADPWGNEEEEEEENGDEAERAPNRLFPEEHIQLICNPNAYPPAHPSFSMLPTCFYIPTDGGELLRPTTAALKNANGRAGWLWGAEDHMGSFYELVGWNPYFSDPKHPFRKY